ncbi:MAG: hypothetical protein P4L50_08805 [Anaerolineaceae bacterium]|nr:hypothetical protein [Anaerolineaceae bacterium]
MNTNKLIIVGVILLLVVVVRGSQLLFSRNKSRNNIPLGSAREYGIAGGAICPKCRRPFRLSLLDMNMGIGSKFTRCEFCGKWSVVHRLSLDELRIAEAAELADAHPDPHVSEKSETEKLKDLVDESRFTDKL